MKNFSQNSINKNRLEIRLDPDSQELLNSLLARTNLTKTSLIKKALIVYASTLNKGHIFTIQYKAKHNTERRENYESKEDPIDKLNWDDIVDELDNK